MIATVRKMPLLALLSAAMLSPLLYAADGNINVTGRVLENACVVDEDSKNATFDFGVLAGNSGLSSTGYGFYMKLLNCPSGVNQVKIRFEGTATSEDVDRKGYIFAPDDQGQLGAVRNVGFMLSSAGDNVKVNSDSLPYELKNTGSGSVNSLWVGVTLLLLNDKREPISPGEVTSTIQFTIMYN
ncbi:type 1 fimbrial protein [Serratia marcescens]|uniref:fimbrial protein n=1 Tax=Serratia marcescens TaxID=615 RepID=UPI00143E5569|nr:fimbrial protein [Serratia marcescens]MBH2603318.1 type 1 fimbrial protein [Serratia marcescens]MBH2893060.1 type 1 fimbrial protein [Serratia marcescens]MBN5391180.1 type 1 fimbrial protein [Serratia marcescens]QIX78196.1 type 1 fimbrial protein [Serratia marcescens]HDT6551887.1 type 1 fimbrial protein [Serratia marcescens]